MITGSMTGRILLIVVMSCLAAGAQSGLPEPAQRKVDFTADIAPIFQAHCYTCHGPAMQMSGLRLDNGNVALRGGGSGPDIKPGHSADSPLVLRVSGAKGFGQMPPSGPRLTTEQIGLIRAWIDGGAVWPGVDMTRLNQPVAAKAGSHWAFQPIRAPQPPKVSDASWVKNPIDAFVLARLEKEKIKPSPEASRPVLLRRLSLDLTGLPPTPDEIDAFVADKRPDAYDRQVDRLLASPHFGEKWARDWLDKARFADSDGYEKDWFRPWAWRYRDWVIKAMNTDMPFDQFTIEQIAGDLLQHPTTADRIATGFNRNTLTNREGGVDNAQFRFENTVDRASTVGVVWLGMSVGCAQCHNHKFDPIPQKDFYSMFAFFDNVEEVDIDAPRPGELGPYLRRHREYEQKRQALLAEYHVPELQADWEQHMRQAIDAPGKYTDWDLAWDVVKKLTEGGDGAKILLTPPEKRTKRESDILTDHFVRNYFFAVGQKKADEAKFGELEKKLTALKSDYPQLSQAMTLAESANPHPSFVRVHGDYRTDGVQVVPAVLSVLPQPAKKDHLTRLDLANWIMSPDNPLTARVAVNRIWQELFGQGIVKSSDDFGTRGDKPSHPELLDWLATEFRDNGWSRKQVIREIVESATYRQSSAARPELETTDPTNTLLARQARLRLPAELIRDSALSVSGLLDTDIGGPSIRPPQPAGVTELGYGKKAGAGWDETKGPERYRRGLYIQFQRSTPYPQLVTFDAPRSDVPVCKRERSNTSLQALNLLNDPVFVESAGALAYRIVTGASGPDARLRLGFRLAMGRDPDDKEAASLEAYLRHQKSIFDAHPQDAAKLASFAAGPSSQMELAAWTGVASVLLNLDEFITRE
jgi:mono/diheme cytochrome c family protein